MRLKDFGLLMTIGGYNDVEFMHRVRCMSDLYARCVDFSALRSRAWKIGVDCVTSSTPLAKVKAACGVYEVEVRLDLDLYRRSSDLEQRQMEIQTLHAGALRVARSERWSQKPFHEGVRRVAEKGYVNEWTWGKSSSGPDRRHKAFVRSLHERSFFRAWLVVVDREQNEVAEELAIDTRPSEFAFARLFGRLTWESKARVALFSKDGRVVKRLSIA